MRVDRHQFDMACEALWTEIEYQNNLARRTDDEAKDVPGFLTLARCYERRVEDDWADNPGTGHPPQVEQALHGLRKVMAIYLRAMVYCGVRDRH